MAFVVSIGSHPLINCFDHIGTSPHDDLLFFLTWRLYMLLGLPGVPTIRNTLLNLEFYNVWHTKVNILYELTVLMSLSLVYLLKVPCPGPLLLTPSFIFMFLRQSHSLKKTLLPCQYITLTPPSMYLDMCSILTCLDMYMCVHVKILPYMIRRGLSVLVILYM